MEDLWVRILEAQRFSTIGRDNHITGGAAAISATLLTLENTSTFLNATGERWHEEKDNTAMTMANFQSHFTKADRAPPQTHCPDRRLPWCARRS
jgi:hypothetical protein